MFQSMDTWGILTMFIIIGMGIYIQVLREKLKECEEKGKQ